MNDALAMLIDPNDFAGQLRAEWIHATSVALIYGALGVVAVLWFYYQRSVKNTDAIKKDAETKRDLAVAVLDEKLDKHIKLSGLEIKDTQYKVGILAAQVKRVIPEVGIPEWPTRT